MSIGTNVHTIIADLKRLRVRTIFLTQPLLFDTSEAWNRWWDGLLGEWKKGELSAATYAKLLDIFNRELISSCRVDSVEVFDLAAEIPHSGDYFYDTMHFNEKGAELVAEKDFRLSGVSSIKSMNEKTVIIALPMLLREGRRSRRLRLCTFYENADIGSSCLLL